MAANVFFLFFLALSTHCGSLAKNCSNNNPCELKTGEPLRHPAQLLSENSQLRTTLRVQMSKVTVGNWLELHRRTYNGKLSGPTWRIRPGDTVTVNLINALGFNKRFGSRNPLNLANSTNLYLHGLHVSPKSNDARIRVEPGQSKEYLHKIGCDHPPGTYWYHPHVHGSTMFQTLSGMAGMIVVEDAVSDGQNAASISSYSCPNHCDHEVHLLFQPTMLYKIGTSGFSFSRVQKTMRDDVAFRNREKLRDGSTLEEWLISRVNNVEYFTTNGQIQPKIRLQAGKTMRFRMVNAGGLHILNIGVPSSKTGDLCQVYEIAADGMYFPYPQNPRHGTSAIPQGGTMDWLIRCNVAGSYKVESTPRSWGRTIGFRGVLASMEVVDAPLSYVKASFESASFNEDVPVALPPLPKYMPNLMNAANDRIGGKFVVETCSNNILNRQKFTGANSAIQYHMPLDSVQEWNLVSVDPINTHTLHLQGNPFQIISYNEYKGPVSVTTSEGTFLIDQTGKFCNSSGINSKSQKLPSVVSLKTAGIRRSKYTPYSGKGYAAPGQWRNTIIVPPLSNTTVRLLPRHFTGKVMLHSHNLLREDFGMKMLINVVEKGHRIEVSNDRPQKGLPGTCGPDDFYPEVPSFGTPTIGKQTFEDFFSWIYRLKPIYKVKYGDQKHISGHYATYLQQLGKEVTDGDHLEGFFEWLYGKVPGYRDSHGDQGYLKELYTFYIARNLTPCFSSKE